MVDWTNVGSRLLGFIVQSRNGQLYFYLFQLIIGLVEIQGHGALHIHLVFYDQEFGIYSIPPPPYRLGGSPPPYVR